VNDRPSHAASFAGLRDETVLSVRTHRSAADEFSWSSSGDASTVMKRPLYGTQMEVARFGDGRPLVSEHACPLFHDVAS